MRAEGARAMSEDAAREEIDRSGGEQFDPDVVAACLRVAVCEWEDIGRRGVVGQQ
jgi:response regulator RpfG family c-di-GMP phosphodiesterase